MQRAIFLFLISSSLISDSPPFKKREFFNRGGRMYDRKSVSLSDGGESDSGCSSQNEGRHEPPPETDYGWDCPSGLSLLLELMTQSPQRYMGRDSTSEHMGLAEVARSTAQGTIAVSGKHHEQTLEPIDEIAMIDINEEADNRVKDRRSDGLTDLAISLVSSKDGARHYDLLTPAASGATKDLSRSLGIENFNYATALKPGGAQKTCELIRGANALYDLSAPNAQRGVPFTQRKINFEENSRYAVHHIARVDHSTTRPESPLDQPIDYSQLSSRSKERREASESPKAYIKTEIELRDSKASGQEEENTVQHQVKEISPNRSVTHPQYEFILSPKMDRNGNLILGQASTQNSNKKISEDILSLHINTTQATHPIASALNAGSTTNDYPGSIGSQRSSVVKPEISSVPLSDNVLEPSAHMETYEAGSSSSFRAESVTPQESSAYRKSLGVYHPKLKYLLAATQFAKKKVEEEEAVRQSERFAFSANSSNSSSRDENLYLSNVQNNRKRSSPGTHDSSPLMKQELGTLHNYSSSNHLIPPPVNDQFAATNNMHQAKMFIMSREASAISNNIQPSGRSDAGVTGKGSTFSHLHHQHQHQHQPHNVFQFEYPPTTNVLSDYQISNLQTGSEDNLFRQFEANIKASSPSNSSTMSSHRSKEHQLTSINQLMFTERNLSASSSSPSSSPASSLEASAQVFKSGLDPYECSECGKRYSTSSNLARHRQTHRSVCDKKARKCPHCDKVYVSMPAYSMHVRTHNQGCQCPHCGKKFSRPWLLQGHIRTHTGEKPFACGQCGKSFADKSNLRAHVQTHSTEKPYVCGRCGKAFALKSYLYKHEESSCMRGQRFNRR